MSNQVKVEAKTRSELGSRAMKRLRDAGHLPGVIYGHKEAIIPITLPRKEVTRHLNHGAHVFALQLDGRNETVLVKEVQYDHLGVDLVHIDFARVNLNETVEVTVSLELKGDPKGEAEGGKLQQVITELHIECLVTDIPDEIRHNVSDMALDDVLHIRDLKLPAGVKCLQDEDLVVATLHAIVEEEEAAAAEGAEPEVIGKAEEAADGEEEKK
jgi:large subunit ribosomal protein L25